ncbi:MAG: hypothetical protein K0Q64_1874, partial [Nitrobacter vulgaris]|nr:hypothetical protein [Nitrobacter vulgaris]
MTARVDENIVADKGGLNRRSCTDVAVSADPDAWANHSSRTDNRTSPDLHFRTDHRQRVDHDFIFEMRRRMYDGGCSDTRVIKPGLRSQHIVMKITSDAYERTKRSFRAQNRHMSRNIGFETRADQTGARLRRRKLRGIFVVVEKREMHGAGLVERGQAGNPKVAPGRIDQLRSRR